MAYLAVNDFIITTARMLHGMAWRGRPAPEALDGIVVQCES